MTVRDIRHHLASTIGAASEREQSPKVATRCATPSCNGSAGLWRPSFPVIHPRARSAPMAPRRPPRRPDRSGRIAVGAAVDGLLSTRNVWVQADEGASLTGATCAPNCPTGAWRGAPDRRGGRLPPGSGARGGMRRAHRPSRSDPWPPGPSPWPMGLRGRHRSAPPCGSSPARDHEEDRRCSQAHPRTRQGPGQTRQQTHRPTPLIQGQLTTNWKEALAQLTAYPPKEPRTYCTTPQDLTNTPVVLHTIAGVHAAPERPRPNRENPGIPGESRGKSGDGGNRTRALEPQRKPGAGPG